jgi:hypothetical protein
LIFPKFHHSFITSLLSKIIYFCDINKENNQEIMSIYLKKLNDSTIGNKIMQKANFGLSENDGYIKSKDPLSQTQQPTSFELITSLIKNSFRQKSGLSNLNGTPAPPQFDSRNSIIINFSFFTYSFHFLLLF